MIKEGAQMFNSWPYSHQIDIELIENRKYHSHQGTYLGTSSAML